MRKWKTNRIEQVLMSNSSLVSGLSEASGVKFSLGEVSQESHKNPENPEIESLLRPFGGVWRGKTSPGQVLRGPPGPSPGFTGSSPGAPTQHSLLIQFVTLHAVPPKGLNRDLIGTYFPMFFLLNFTTFLGDFTPGELDSRSLGRT